MEKIIVVGSPGSGKSTLSKEIGKILNYPVLHLDKVYHIDNHHQIKKSELIQIIMDFINNHSRFIIDGNYLSTMELRASYCDTIIFMDIEQDICLKNVLNRTKKKYRSDMADGFNNTIIDKNFIDFVKNFAEFKKITDIEINC